MYAPIRTSWPSWSSTRPISRQSGHAHPLDAVRIGVRPGVPAAGHALVEVVARDREVRVPGHLQGPGLDRRASWWSGTDVVGTVVGDRLGHALDPDLGDVRDRLPAGRVHADEPERPDVLAVDLDGERRAVQGVRDDVVRAERDLLAREGLVVPVGRDHADGVALLGERPVEREVRVLVPVVDVADEPPEGHALPGAVRVRVARAVAGPPEALLEVGLGDVALDRPVQQDASSRSTGPGRSRPSRRSGSRAARPTAGRPCRRTSPSTSRRRSPSCPGCRRRGARTGSSRCRHRRRGGCRPE